MYGIDRFVSNLGLHIFIFALVLMFSVPSYAARVTINMAVPVSGVAHIQIIGVPTPITIENSPLSTDQNLANLLENDPNTFYQPTAGSNASAIGSDVLLDFEFSEIPDNARIESVTLRVGVSAENTDAAFLMGFAFAAYNRLDPTTYLDVDLGPPGTIGPLLVSLMTTPFPFPPIIVLPVPIPSIFEMDLTLDELTVDNVRNLSVAVIGVNEAPQLFDRVSLVNATVVYIIPEIPTLSTWMMALLGVMLLGAEIIFRRRFVKS